MSLRISSRYMIKPDLNGPQVPRDPLLRLQPYLHGGCGTEQFVIGRPLKVSVPRQWWNRGEPPSPVQLAIEISDMPEITGEEVEAFKGFPWNVCFYVACSSFQSEDFFEELRSNGCAPPWDPWFVTDAVHGGRSAPLFQFDTATEDEAKLHAQAAVPWLEQKFPDLMKVPINRIGSHGWDWLRGDLVSRPGLANVGGGVGRVFA